MPNFFRQPPSIFEIARSLREVPLCVIAPVSILALSPGLRS